MRAGFRAVVAEATIPEKAKPSPINAAANRSLRKGQVIVPALYTSNCGHLRTFRRVTF